LCDVKHDGKTEKTAQFWPAIARASELFFFPFVVHTYNCAVLSGNPRFHQFTCRNHIVTRTRRHTEMTKKWQAWWETCAVQENIQFSFSCRYFLHS
jgi:hypothetical protein